MKSFLNKRWIFLILSIAFFSSIYAQDSEIENVELISDSLPRNELSGYEDVELPPLSVLFENAKNSASLNYFKTLKKQEKSALKSINRDWTKYIRVDGSYRYGKNSMQSVSDDAIGAPKQDKFQSWYSAGISLSIPLEDIIDRGQRKHRQKLRIQAVDEQLEGAYAELKMSIVELYTQAQKELEVLKMRIEELTLSEARYKEAEVAFLNGTLSTQELGDQKNMQVTSIQNYIESVHNLSNVLLKLEILTNTPIFNSILTTQSIKE